MSYRHGIVGVEDEAVIRSEVAYDAELGFHIVLKIVVVPVQMVRSDVGDDCDVGPEIEASVQLETADFQNIVVVVLGCYLKGVALANVASQAYIESCLLQEIVDEGSSGGLAVGPGDADFLRGVITRRELDFGYDVCPLCFKLFHNGNGVGNTRALDYLICAQYEFLSMAALLIGNLPTVEDIPVFLLDFPVV